MRKIQMTNENVFTHKSLLITTWLKGLCLGRACLSTMNDVLNVM